MAREKRIEVRVDADEKAQITALAAEAGFTGVGDYMRTVALQPAAPGSDPAPSIVEAKPEPPPTPLPPPSVNAGIDGKGQLVKLHPDLDAEVREAKLADDPAAQAFIERRARQLVGAGRTTIVARREAEAEWRNRAS